MRFSFRGNCLFIFLFAATLLATPPGYHEPWGNDCDLKAPAPTKEKKAPSLAVRMADSIIKFHQEVISPVDGPRSHYRPSSSQHMHLAMHRYGFFKGFIMGCDRLLRENDEEWVYRKVEVDGCIFKYDPAKENKYD